MDIPGLQVELPQELLPFFGESGYLPSMPDEFRTNARLRVRLAAALSFAHTPRGLQEVLFRRRSRSGVVLVKDMSRSGLGLLYHEQIYPCERLDISFQNRLFEVAVVRCRKLGEKCYEVGARILAISAENNGEES